VKAAARVKVAAKAAVKVKRAAAEVNRLAGTLSTYPVKDTLSPVIVLD
jgi:hypothetical protein